MDSVINSKFRDVRPREEMEAAAATVPLLSKKRSDELVFFRLLRSSATKPISAALANVMEARSLFAIEDKSTLDELRKDPAISEMLSIFFSDELALLSFEAAELEDEEGSGEEGEGASC